jgi:hypothetical protein
MKHLYEIFEKFPDHSSLWRDSAVGAMKVQDKALKMARGSANEFYAIDLTSGKVVKFGWIFGRAGTPAGFIGELQSEYQCRLDFNQREKMS